MKDMEFEITETGIYRISIEKIEPDLESDSSASSDSSSQSSSSSSSSSSSVSISSPSSLSSASSVSSFSGLIPSTVFTHGTIPTDGFLEDPAVTRGRYRVGPALIEGQRISGIAVTVSVSRTWPVADESPTWRLLVDGIPQPSETINTTLWADGSHVIATQIMDTKGLSVRHGSVVVVFNNSGEPFTDLLQQAVVTKRAATQYAGNSLAWGRVDVKSPKSFPLNPQLDEHPIAENDLDRQRLINEKVWWVEGLNHAGITPLWSCMPFLMKNKYGDYFIKQFNPQGGGSGVLSANAQPWVDRGPAYDGPRGIGWLSPYTTLVADKHHVLESGQTGWLGVDLAGRVTRVDIDGSVKTILGPRSTTGVVGTDSDENSVGLDDRLANGEKEYIGDDGGLPLNMPQDIWVCASFPSGGLIADTSNNRVVEIHLTGQKLMQSWSIPEVSSVWGSYELQQQKRIRWVAANPEGLWWMNADKIVVKVADIPNAFWVRTDGLRIYILTKDLGLYEYDIEAEVLTERILHIPGKDGRFVFMAVDENGSIGPRGRLYWSYAMSKTSIFWIDTDDWSTGSAYRTQIVNRKVYGNWLSNNDPFGHYLWGFTPHSTLPKFVSCGITSSGWFLWSGCLGDTPVTDHAISWDGTSEWRNGKLDKSIAPNAVFGFNGHGNIGYSCDDFRDYNVFEEARLHIRSVLDQFCGAGMTEVDKENMARLLFAQRTQERY